MRLEKPTRLKMLSTVTEMKSRLEDLCQREYASINHYQQEIVKSQERLEKLELEYVNCDRLIKSIEDKIRQDS